MSSIQKNIVSAAVRGIVQIVFPTITVAYVSRILNPDGIGKINFSNTFVGYFILIGGLGINRYGTREGAKSRRNPAAVSQLAAELLAINGFMTVVSMVLFAIVVLFAEQTEAYRSILLIYGFAIPLSALSMEWLYYSMEEYLYITKRITLCKTLGFVCVFLFVRTKQDILVFAVIQVASNYGNYLLNFWHAGKYVSFRSVEQLKIRRHIVPIVTLFAASVSSSIYSSIDITMLGFMSSDWEVGIYSVAIKVVHMLLGLCDLIIGVFLPRIIFLKEEGEELKVQKYRDEICHFVFMGIVPCIIALLVWGRVIIYCFAGGEFEGAYSILCFLVGNLLFSNIKNLYESTMFLPAGKDRLIAGAMAGAMFVNIVLNILVISRWGGKGAAAASFFSEALIAGIYITAGKKAGMDLRVFKNMKTYLLGGGLVMVVWVLAERIFPSAISVCVATTLMGTVAYLLLLVSVRDAYFRKLTEWAHACLHRIMTRV